MNNELLDELELEELLELELDELELEQEQQ